MLAKERILIKKVFSTNRKDFFYLNWATTYSPRVPQVPSALTGLTSLFGMERGDPRRIRHPNPMKFLNKNIYQLVETYEKLVLLGYDITAFTPIAYQRRNLQRLLKRSLIL